MPNGEETRWVQLRNKIRELYDNRDYKDCIIKCDEFLNILNKETYDTRYFYWFCYNMKGSSYLYYNKEKNNIILAIKNMKLATLFATKPFKIISYDIVDNNIAYINTIWMLSRCLENTNIKEALHYYNLCEKYYEYLYKQDKNNKEIAILYADVLNNTARLVYDETIIKKAIEIYIDVNAEINIIDNAYDSMLEILEKNHNVLLMQKYIYKIKNQNLRKEWRKRVFDQSLKIANTK